MTESFREALEQIMCGRLTLKTPGDQLSQMLLPLVSEVRLPSNYQPRYNIAPTQTVLGVANGLAGHELSSYRWGLVPPWAPDFNIGSRMINARRETLLEKRSFRAPLEKRRCLIVADGYYEWKPLSSQTKQAYWITPRGNGLLLLAGLWEINSKASGQPIETCTIITTAANSTMQRVHDRMPMPLDLTTARRWLNPTLTAEKAFELLTEVDADFLTCQPVSSFVNNARNEGPECIATT